MNSVLITMKHVTTIILMCVLVPLLGASEETPSEDIGLKKVSAELTAAVGRHSFVWLGMGSDEAAQKAVAEEKKFRVVSRNGKYVPVTRDFLKGRLNVYLWQGRVIAVKKEGFGLLEGCPDAAFLPYLGCDEQTAQAKALQAQVPYRVVSKDGEPMAVTADFLAARVNAHLIKDKLVAVSGG